MANENIENTSYASHWSVSLEKLIIKQISLLPYF